MAKNEEIKTPPINERAQNSKILEYFIDRWQFFSYNIVINKIIRGRRRAGRQKMREFPEGSVRVACGYCKQTHTIKLNDFFTCPESMTSGGSFYIAVDRNGIAEESSNFENIINFLGLKIIKA